MYVNTNITISHYTNKASKSHRGSIQHSSSQKKMQQQIIRSDHGTGKILRISKKHFLCVWNATSIDAAQGSGIIATI